MPNVDEPNADAGALDAPNAGAPKAELVAGALVEKAEKPELGEAVEVVLFAKAPKPVDGLPKVD